MKKLLILFTLVAGFCMFSCNGKKNPVIIDNVEATISTDRENMFVNHGDYSWFETVVNYKDFLDEENDGSIVTVTSVFQTVTPIDSASFDVKVFVYNHADGKDTTEVNEGPWVEDCVLNNEQITLTFKDAFNKLMEANIVKPHSKVCVLRKAVGPKEANVQYIFGNEDGAVFVDAVTGDVTDVDPFFTETKEEVTE